MAITVYPLDDIDFAAEDVAIYNSTRTSGIYAGDDFAISLTGADNTISIDVGLAWMRLSKFHGVAVALKAKTSLDMGIPDATYPRIDALVLQFDANKNGAEIVSKLGTASSSPQPPVVSQTEALYELHLLHVLRQPGAASITAADVTDLRLDETYCGLMADAVTRVDTTAINAQVSALIQKLREDLAAVEKEDYYASKEYVDLRAYPVGAIYMSADATSPASLFGGTWEQLKDRFLLGAGDSYSAGATGGNAAEALTVPQLPAHNHIQRLVAKTMNGSAGTENATGYDSNIIWSTTMVVNNSTVKTNDTGSGEAHNNMPPYLVIYMWKRVA